MPQNYTQSLALEVRDFLYENTENYLNFLSNVKIFLKNIKSEIARDNIYRIYTRKDNQNTNSEFKSIEKIAEKLTLWRTERPDSKIKDIHDIIGVTIVVYYINDIEPIFHYTKSKCDKYDLQISEYLSSKQLKPYSDFGYYAQHFILTSKNPIHAGIKCEVQIKTLMHDAWHAKTHDLVYKPPGELGEELLRLMRSFGESIQALEVQSEVIRSLITQHWIQEEELRHSARLHMIDWLEEKSFGNVITNQNYLNILLKINDSKDDIRTCGLADPLMRELLNDIENLSNMDEGISAAWLLMVCVASIRHDSSLNGLAKDYLRAFIEKNGNNYANCWRTSFAYHMMGERAGAINEIQNYLLTSRDTQEDLAPLKFNLLYYLIEEASYSPHNIYEIKRRCDEILGDLDFGSLKQVPSTHAKDTLGFYNIVFGETREDIQKGIRMCQEAYKENLEKGELNEKYMDLHEKVGWRRYLNSKK